MSLFDKLFRRAVASAATCVAISAGSAGAQEPAALPPAIADLPGLTAENPLQAASGFGRHKAAPGCAPYVPCPPGYAYPPGVQPMPPGMGDPMTPQPQPQVPSQAPDIGDLSSGAGIGPDVGLNGYVENAVPNSMVRLRFDSAYNNNRPDRGNFFYPKTGVLRSQRADPVQRAAALRDANGPLLAERSVDYQELTATGEYAFTRRMSAFFDIPVRFLNPDVNANEAGLGDISFGTKYAVVYNRNRVTSLFLRFQAPAGDLSRGLGTGTWWIEPGLLHLEQLNARWQAFGEFRFLTPLGLRTDFTGNLIRYGLGTSYIVAQGRWGYVAPVVETVGWTVLSGQEFNPDSFQVVRASGDTIVNAKLGVRFGFGARPCDSPALSRSDLYIGYARPLTGEVWYKDFLRVEFRRFF